MKTTKNYPLLLVSQFLGAFGDNFFLWLIIGPLTFQQEKGLISAKDVGTTNAIYTCLLYAPYVLLAPVAGYLNDRFPKTHWLTGGNLIKLSGTLLAMLSLTGHHLWQGIGYFIIGIGACVFSPAKYGVLPEILPEERLVKANGTVEMLTIMAVLTGILGGAWMVDHHSLPVCFGAVLGIYGLSTLLSLLMTRTPCNTSIRLADSASEFVKNTKSIFTHPRLGRILVGTGLFWAAGSILKMNFQPWGLNTLGLKTNSSISLLSLWLAVGIIIGSVLAGQLHRVGDLRGVRRYGFLLSGLVAALAAITSLTPHAMMLAILILAGMAGGLFLIPLNASLQAESDPTKLGKTIATQNLVDNMAMMIGGVMVFTVASFNGNAPLVFMCEAALVGLVSLWFQFPEKTLQPKT